MYNVNYTQNWTVFGSDPSVPLLITWQFGIPKYQLVQKRWPRLCQISAGNVTLIRSTQTIPLGPLEQQCCRKDVWSISDHGCNWSQIRPVSHGIPEGGWRWEVEDGTEYFRSHVAKCKQTTRPTCSDNNGPSIYCWNQLALPASTSQPSTEPVVVPVPQSADATKYFEDICLNELFDDFVNSNTNVSHTALQTNEKNPTDFSNCQFTINFNVSKQ